MLRRAFVPATSLALATVLAACATGRTLPFDPPTDIAAADGAVATLVDFLATGRRLVDAHVAGWQPADRARLAAVDALALRSTVRIAARTGTAFAYSEQRGSGVLVADGNGGATVLTAGHVCDDDDANTTIRCQDSSGNPVVVTQVTAVHRSIDEDHARLACSHQVTEQLPSTADPRAGSLVVAYGYPDVCGVDARGRVVKGDAFDGAPLAPIRLLLRVIATSPLRLEPVAGSVPLGGFSGGGIFDLDGKVVGVLVATQWEPSREALRVAIVGVPAAAIR